MITLSIVVMETYQYIYSILSFVEIKIIVRKLFVVVKKFFCTGSVLTRRDVRNVQIRNLTTNADQGKFLEQCFSLQRENIGQTSLKLNRSLKSSRRMFSKLMIDAQRFWHEVV